MQVTMKVEVKSPENKTLNVKPCIRCKTAINSWSNKMCQACKDEPLTPLYDIIQRIGGIKGLTDEQVNCMEGKHTLRYHTKYTQKCEVCDYKRAMPKQFVF